MAPTSASEEARGSPRCTAPTRTPIAMAKAAGSAPRSRRTNHHARASPGAALGRAAKNSHNSLRSFSGRNMSALCLKKILCVHKSLVKKGAAREDRGGYGRPPSDAQANRASPSRLRVNGRPSLQLRFEIARRSQVLWPKKGVMFWGTKQPSGRRCV